MKSSVEKPVPLRLLISVILISINGRMREKTNLLKIDLSFERLRHDTNTAISSYLLFPIIIKSFKFKLSLDIIISLLKFQISHGFQFT